METTISALRRDIRVLKMYCFFLSLALLAFMFLAFRPQVSSDAIIRTRGIIVTDEHGKDRILIGAPVPNSADRIRSSFEKAKGAWGKRYPSFEWYRSVDNAANGIIVLDEHGFDRIAIGDPVVAVGVDNEAQMFFRAGAPPNFLLVSRIHARHSWLARPWSGPARPLRPADSE